MNFNWNHAKSFLICTEHGSLSAAARELGLTPSTLSRQITSLEEKLGVILFERDPSGLFITETGKTILKQIQTMKEAAEQVNILSSSLSENIAGTVSISATDMVTAFVLPKIIEKLRKQHPNIKIELITTKALSNIKHREADIAIRGMRPTELELIGRKIGDLTAHMYACEKYLSKAGIPTSTDHLRIMDFISDHPEGVTQILSPFGIELSRCNFPIIAECAITQWELVKLGLGIALFPDQLMAHYPEMIRVLPDIHPFKAEIWLVVHQELHTSQRIRVVFDFIAEELLQWFMRSPSV